jgi:hypothetical protein
MFTTVIHFKRERIKTYVNGRLKKDTRRIKFRIIKLIKFERM